MPPFYAFSWAGLCAQVENWLRIFSVGDFAGERLGYWPNAVLTRKDMAMSNGYPVEVTLTCRHPDGDLLNCKHVHLVPTVDDRHALRAAVAEAAEKFRTMLPAAFNAGGRPLSPLTVMAVQDIRFLPPAVVSRYVIDGTEHRGGGIAFGQRLDRDWRQIVQAPSAATAELLAIAYSGGRNVRTVLRNMGGAPLHPLTIRSLQPWQAGEDDPQLMTAHQECDPGRQAAQAAVAHRTLRRFAAKVKAWASVASGRAAPILPR